VARISGINIPLNKHVVIALTSIFGIGNSRAKQICSAAGIAPETQVKDLAEPEVAISAPLWRPSWWKAIFGVKRR